MKALNNEIFKKFSNNVFSSLESDEDLTLNYSAENSLFARYSNAKVRQATHVNQAVVECKIIKGNKTISFAMNFAGELEKDYKNFEKLLVQNKKFMEGLSDDPYLVRPTSGENSCEETSIPSLNDEEVMLLISKNSSGVDLAGLLASGEMVRASANSKGQYHWFKTKNFSLDYSLYNSRQKAVKSLYAGQIFNEEDFKINLSDAKTKLSLMDRPSKKVDRGAYRVYFAPSAVGELMGILGWSGVSMGAHQRGQGPFKKLWEKKEKLSPKFNLVEDFSIGLSPRFNEIGEVAPKYISLIEKGELKNFLISSRTANEYKLTSNFASPGEGFRSPVIKEGTLSRDKILSTLGTGLYISDLHYLNWSDRESARLTGMTRYACFWVENGEIISPIEDLRFDESLYNIFGNALVDLTDFSEMAPSTGTYFERNIGGMKTPGIIVSEFKFTL